MPKFQETKLSNGFRILTEHHSGTKALSMCIGVHTGSRDEVGYPLGITHLIEHLVFRGTKTRSALKISEEIEMLGGDLNAYTGREMTCYHVHLLSQDYKTGIDILSDIVLNPKLSETDLKKEKEVIGHEIAMTEDYHEEQIFDDFYEKWYPGQSIGQPILGTYESLKKITKEKIKSYRKDRYTPDNMVFVACGNLKHDEVVREVKKYFSKQKASKKKVSLKAPSEKKLLELKKTNTEQCHMLFGFPASSYNNGILYEPSIINTYLGSGSTSLLNQDLREKRPLCYSVYSSFSPLEDVGAFLIYIGTENQRIEEVSEIIWKRLKQIYKNGIPDTVLENIKKQWVRGLILQSEDLESRMNIILQDAFLGREYRPISKIKNAVEKVSKDSIRKYIDDFFQYKDISLLVFSNEKKSRVKKIGEIFN